MMRESGEGEIVVTDFEAVPIAGPHRVAVKGGIMAIIRFTARRDARDDVSKLTDVTEP